MMNDKFVVILMLLAAGLLGVWLAVGLGISSAKCPECTECPDCTGIHIDMENQIMETDGRLFRFECSWVELIPREEPHGGFLETLPPESPKEVQDPPQ